MTVKELKDLLDTCDDDLEVQIQNGDDGGDYEGSREIRLLNIEKQNNAFQWIAVLS